MNATYWLILFVVLLVIEIVTMGLTTIWFAGGALIAFVAALLGANVIVQGILFIVVSVILLFATRPMAMKWINKGRVMTNVDSLPGQTGVVTTAIHNLQGEGEVTLNGMTWTARSKDDAVSIEAGRKVIVIEIKGVKLIVEEKKDEQKEA